MANVQTDLSTQQLADRLKVTPRMINIYRSKAEQRLGRELGQKRGRTTYFNPDEQAEIQRIQAEGINVKEVGQAQTRTTGAANLQTLNNQAEEGIAGGMNAIVKSGDRNAIEIGQALGQRWNQLLWTAALQEMQTGMVEMQSAFEEMHTSVKVSFSQIDQQQLTGADANFFLEEGDAEP